MRLTDAGARFLERARRILVDLEEAELSAHDERAQPRGTLTVAAPLLFGRLHIAPLVSRFMDAYPDVRADLRLSDRYANLVEDGLDVAIRIGQLPDSGLVARRLSRTRRALVASPAYLGAVGGPPAHPRDLARHRLIAFEATTVGGAWPFHDPDGDDFETPVIAHFSTNSGDAAIDRALAGGGITAALCYQVDVPVSAGALVEVLRDFAPPPAPIQAVFPTSRLLSAKVRAFLDIVEVAARAWKFLG
jgi:DNA-binding transcriptional LysR family regulator